jgi:zinc protease
MIRIVSILLALVLWAGPGQVESAHASDKILDIQEVTSPSGITAWLVKDKTLPIISLSFSFKNAGSKQDPAELQGLAQLASNTMDEGAGDIESDAFQGELQDKSITLRYRSGRDHFGGSLKTLSKYQDRAFELLRLSLTQPRFDPAPVKRMAQANQARIRRSQSDPQWVAARIMNDKAYNGHPYALNSGGTLTTLDKITPYDLQGFAKDRLAKDNLVVAVAGNISVDDLKVVLDHVFAALPDKAKLKTIADTSVQNTGKTFLYTKDIPQSIIQISQPGIGRKSPDYYTAQVMNFVLGSSGFGSRLTEEIREKRGLTYGIYSYMNDMNHVQTLNVSTSTENKNAETMIDLIRTEWQKLRDSPVSVEELKNAKSYLIGALPLSMTSTNKISGLMLSLMLDDLPSDYLSKRNAQINAVSAQDIQTFTRKTLNSQNWISVIVGNPTFTNEAISIETIAAPLPNVE